MVCIVDFSMGNLRSVQKAFERIKIPAIISSNSEEILSSNKIVLPGVGNFEKGIYNLKFSGLFETLNEAVIVKGIPILGICLGMQLMTEHSEEGNIQGFGWIKAKTIKLYTEKSMLKIPHMGWNNLFMKNKSELFSNITSEDLFYFAHSYFVKCEDPKNILTETNYGFNFVSSFNKNNIYGCQFHPEKSHDIGLKVIKNFTEL